MNSCEPYDPMIEKRMILVADAETADIEQLRSILEDCYEILYASDGKEAIQKIEENAQTISLVLMDLMKQKTRGIDILKRLKGNPELEHIPVIICTADQSAEVASLRSGAIDFILKPYQRKEVILARIDRAIELAGVREAALKDALTGVKNKLAYVQEEQRINAEIIKGKALEFGLVFCDVNGLKRVNDSMGHQKGDSFIQAACMEICHTFQHSPVFRVGGDEFIAILRGADYNNRRKLLSALMEKNNEFGEATISCGLAEYIPGRDRAVSDVYERADSLMYENKKLLNIER